MLVFQENNLFLITIKGLQVLTRLGLANAKILERKITNFAIKISNLFYHFFFFFDFVLTYLTQTTPLEVYL